MINNLALRSVLGTVIAKASAPVRWGSCQNLKRTNKDENTPTFTNRKLAHDIFADSVFIRRDPGGWQGQRAYRQKRVEACQLNTARSGSVPGAFNICDGSHHRSRSQPAAISPWSRRRNQAGD